MKRLIIPALLMGISFVVACGPSAEEKAAAEQRMKDSIAEVERIKAEEAMALQMKAVEDSLALVAEQQRVADSIAAAAAKPVKSGTKPKPKPAPAPVKEEPKSVKDLMGGDKSGTSTDGKPKSIKDKLKEGN